ncbi:signal-transducing adaptor protein 1-like isoform X2 [Kryptolebias marmoratus]|uniref:signal-transducing adaptor protein 1-like isoform X2 n=1 Tax=Kryptolebias marmoratus TaxID=37003 RepID=UPI0007F92876|nr:signal-transducing adaptor protein 1-like isoform X2 [Kryptolebias marmoratus]
MAVHPRVVHKRRQTITALPLYYSGNLLKRSSRETSFRSFYGELRGATLFLYDDDTQVTYVEKLELEQLKSMEMESPYKNRQPTIFTLNLQSEEVQLKMDCADTAEEWRGYILTVVKKEIPKQLQLLPGQMIKLEEVLLLEGRRNPQLARPPLPPRPSEQKPKNTTITTTTTATTTATTAATTGMPSCFFDVSRQEAEKMLEDNPENGSIILRPSAMPKNYALTLRQKTSSGPVLKNYRVTSTNLGFVIDLDSPVSVPSLDDVLKFFLQKTEYRLCPYVACQPYDTRIDSPVPPKCISVSSPPPIAPPRAQVLPMMRSKTREELYPPPEKADEGEYVVPDDHVPDDHSFKLAGQ